MIKRSINGSDNEDNGCGKIRGYLSHSYKPQNIYDPSLSSKKLFQMLNGLRMAKNDYMFHS